MINLYYDYSCQCCHPLHSIRRPINPKESYPEFLQQQNKEKKRQLIFGPKQKQQQNKTKRTTHTNNIRTTKEMEIKHKQTQTYSLCRRMAPIPVKTRKEQR